MQSVRINNDTEGWHRRIIGEAHGSSIAFYLLEPLLHPETQLAELQVRLVSEKKVCRTQKKMYKTRQACIFRVWEQYVNGEKSAEELLKTCARYVKM